MNAQPLLYWAWLVICVPLLIVWVAYKVCQPSAPPASRAPRHRTGSRFPDDAVPGDTFTFQGNVWEWNARRRSWSFLRKAPRSVWWR